MTGAFTFREQQICRVVHHVYCPKALSHANRLLPKTAYRNVFTEDDPEHIPGWLSVMLKVSCAGDAGTQILSSPVKGFSDNKRHSFHLSGRVFSGRRGFFIYYTSKSNHR